MRFYDRLKEFEILQEADRLKEKQSVMTMLIGRRRVGKTALALKYHSDNPKLYFFVSRKNEVLLCEEFIEEIELKLNKKIIGSISNFEDLFAYLLNLGKKNSFTIIIDEFQDFYKVNPSIYSNIQKLWDINKGKTHIHLIACGSLYSMMQKIFIDSKEPLFGRADYKIDLKPFNASVLQEILTDYNSYTNDNMLNFFVLTGGIAKYVAFFVLYNTFNLKSMIERIVSQNSIFLDEGKSRLIEEFGKEYTTYFSVLSLIASSKTSKSAIESILQKNISGYLYRLEIDYNIIKSIKPITAKPNSKVQKYEIKDNFLNFWFRFIFKYQSLIEAENYNRLKEIIFRDFDTFRGRFLEKLYIDLLKEKEKYTTLGSYWERGNKNEIDIVAVDDIDKELLICEVKLNKDKLNKTELIKKSMALVEKYNKYTVEYRLLSLDDLFVSIIS